MRKVSMHRVQFWMVAGLVSAASGLFAQSGFAQDFTKPIDMTIQKKTAVSSDRTISGYSLDQPLSVEGAIAVKTTEGMTNTQVNIEAPLTMGTIKTAFKPAPPPAQKNDRWRK